MGLKAWLYFGFTTLLSIVLIGIMVYYFRNKRKDKVESPKYRMLEDDEEKIKHQRVQSRNTRKFTRIRASHEDLDHCSGEYVDWDL
jgi:cbb3-type cytochrome oxidase subunit 3